MSKQTKIGLLFVALAGLLALGGCTGVQKSLEGAAPPAPPVPGTIGIRNLDQLTLSMSTVTGVPVVDGAGTPTKAVDYTGSTMADPAGGGNLTFASFNTTITPWLSADGNASSVTASMLLSATGLSGIFCSTLLNNESKAPNLLKVVKFSSGSKGLTPTVTGSVIQTFSSLFWRRDPTASEIQILTQSIADATAGLSGTGITDPSSQATQAVLLVPCTAALSSIAFLSI